MTLQTPPGSTERLPIIDLANFPLCEDYDEDCRTMSLEDVAACMRGGIIEVKGSLYELDQVRGICKEMQIRQASH